MKDEPENTPIPTKAAKAMCWNLVDAGLGFEKLHSIASQAREIGPSNHLESVLRQTFLSKISGFPADEVDQVIFCSKKLLFLVMYSKCEQTSCSRFYPLFSLFFRFVLNILAFVVT